MALPKCVEMRVLSDPANLRAVREAVLRPLVSVHMLILSCPDSYNAKDIRSLVAKSPSVEDVAEDFDLEPTPVRIEDAPPEDTQG